MYWTHHCHCFVLAVNSDKLLAYSVSVLYDHVARERFHCHIETTYKGRLRLWGCVNEAFKQTFALFNESWISKSSSSYLNRDIKCLVKYHNMLSLNSFHSSSSSAAAMNIENVREIRRNLFHNLNSFWREFSVDLLLQLSFLHNFIYKLSSVLPQKYIPQGMDAINLCSRHKLKRFIWRNYLKHFSDLRFHHFTGFSEVYSSRRILWTMLYQHYHHRIIHLQQLFEKIHENEF